MTPELKKSSNARLFGEMISQGIELITQACEIYAKDINEDPKKQGLYEIANPSIPRGVRKNFLALGSGVMDSRLLYDFSPGGKKLKNLSIQRQKNLIESPVDVYLPEKDDFKKVMYNKLSALQAEAVFTRKAVRTIEEQKTFILLKNVRNSKDKSAFKRIGNEIQIGNIYLSKEDVMEMMALFLK
ncbi:MAG: hypothetical protein HRT88_09685 [Lentisphaeraceae bacterium]|nr:hypothetical protein [Lentisphaeraceae bacterium]